MFECQRNTFLAKRAGIINYAPTRGVFSLRLISKTKLCHPTDFRMNRKSRLFALQFAVFWRVICRLLQGGLRQIGKALTVRRLQTRLRRAPKRRR